MKSLKNLIGIIALVAVIIFSMTACDSGFGDSGDDGSEGSSGSVDIWTNVTSLYQVNGTWKASSNFTAYMEGMKVTGILNNYTITFNANTKTMTVSGAVTEIISGGNINELWSDFKNAYGEYINGLDGVTVTFNDANHSYTTTYNNFSQTITDNDLSYLDLKINQNGTKLKAISNLGSGMSIEIIYVKQ